MKKMSLISPIIGIKKVVSFSLLLIFFNLNAQTKKEQILALKYKVDSLNINLKNARDSFFLERKSNVENKIILNKLIKECNDSSKELAYKLDLCKQKYDSLKNSKIEEISKLTDSIIFLNKNQYNELVLPHSKLDFITDKSDGKHFTIDDLINYSKSKYGFVDKQGDVNQYFGDLECTSVEKKQFDFTVGCGRGGDIIQISITENSSKLNCFDLYLESGALYFGEFLTAKKKIGELIIISENEIKGSIKLCLEKDSSCCGEEGEDFTLKRISN